MGHPGVLPLGTLGESLKTVDGDSDLAKMLVEKGIDERETDGTLVLRSLLCLSFLFPSLPLPFSCPLPHSFFLL